MSSTFWSKDGGDAFRELAQQVSLIGTAVTTMQGVVYKNEESMKEMRETLRKVEDTLLAMNVHRSEAEKRSCPAPGSCITLREEVKALKVDMGEQVKPLKVDVEALKTDRSKAAGALVLLGVVGTAFIAAVVKLFFDAFSKHP